MYQLVPAGTSTTTILIGFLGTDIEYVGILIPVAGVGATGSNYYNGYSLNEDR